MTQNIHRFISSKIKEALKYFPVLLVTGPRQSGKTHLCKHLFPDYEYVNLEDLSSRAFAVADPERFLQQHGNPLIIDEAQNVPDLLSAIQVRVDNNPKLRYIITGSCNFTLMRTITQSLAGRVAMFTLLPLSLREISSLVESHTIEDILFQGQYPGVIAGEIPPQFFYYNYYRTYVERDVRQLMNVKNILNFDKFVHLLATRAGSELNCSSMAKEVGVASTTIKDWLSILDTSYITFNISPYYANIGKRLTKMPKVYFHDTGLLCYLLGIEQPSQLVKHPLRGAIFENLAISEMMKQQFNLTRDPNLYFYRESAGKEVDAVLSVGGRLHLYEIKAASTFKTEFISNMRHVAQVLPGVASSIVVYDGTEFGGIATNIRKLALPEE